MAELMSVYDHIQSNNRKTLLLVLAFPICLLAVCYGLLMLVLWGDPQQIELSNHFWVRVALPLSGVALVWSGVSCLFGDKMMLGFAGAKQIPDTPEYQQIYRSVENVALAAGLPTPKVYIIEDDSLNAFATGYSPKSASIALTRGIINKLEPLELQAVIAHEMGHIGNRDIRLDMMIVIGLGVCAFLGEAILRSVHGHRRQKKEDGVAVIVLIGVAFLIFSKLLAPLIHMALSRTREYAADAASAYITRNPLALASALRKISTDARVEVLDDSKNMAQVCIFDPTVKGVNGLSSTHPPVAARIKRLENMAGQFSV